MIVTIFLNFIYAIVHAVLAVTILNLSDVSASSTLTSAITWVLPYLALFNSILPMTTIFAALAARLAIEAIVIIYKIVMWFLRRIPTQS